MLLLDAHPGISVNTMRSLNPAVLDENDPSKIDASLDPFDPKNGFNPNGQSVYTQEFMDRYFKAQAARMNRLIDKALARKAAIKAGKGLASDDEAFVFYHDRARLMDFSSRPSPTSARQHGAVVHTARIAARSGRWPPELVHHRSGSTL